MEHEAIRLGSIVQVQPGTWAVAGTDPEFEWSADGTANRQATVRSGADPGLCGVGGRLVSDGGPKPYRLKWRGASFSNLAVLPHIVPGHKVADVVAIMGSVDPVFGEVDR